jgi:hypothetical protein
MLATRNVLLGIAVTMGLWLGCGAPDGGSPPGSSQTCKERHECINGACKCMEGPKQGNSCCDPTSSTCTTNKCDEYCKYCS